MDAKNAATNSEIKREQTSEEPSLWQRSPLFRHLVVVVVIKLVALILIWWFFIRDAKVHVDTDAMQQQLFPSISQPQSGETK